MDPQSTALPTLPLRRGLLLGALAGALAPAFIRHARAGSVPRFALGLASGCPRPDRLVLWTRLCGPDLPPQVEVTWELAEDEGFARVIARGRELALAADAHSVHAEPAGLKPDRPYWYRFSALGQRSGVGRTRSAPVPDAAVSRLRFAIASCQRWDHGEYAAWGDMARQELDLLLFLGDYIYESASAPGGSAPRRHQGGVCRSLADYRQRYAQYKSDPQLQAMHAQAPWIVIWDDHEVDNDWAGDRSQALEPDFGLRRAAAAKAFWEHMPFTQAMRPAGPQGHSLRLNQRYDWGRLARIITLDDRQWRDPQACPKPGRGGSNTVSLRDCPELLDPQRSLLGAEQERWLAQSWDPSRPWNLLAQQTLMARMNWQANPAEPPVHWTDGWDGYPLARQRLLADLAARQLPNAVVLGGDVHAHYVADLKLDFSDEKSPVLASEFCGTSISSQGLDPARIAQALPHNPHLRYGRSEQRGYMKFDLRAAGLDVELRNVQQAWDAHSAVQVAARFHVAAGQPGAQPL